MTKHISLNLGGAWNSRDVASITNIKPGVLLRSANLAKLSNSGQEKLLELGVKQIFLPGAATHEIVEWVRANVPVRS